MPESKSWETPASLTTPMPALSEQRVERFTQLLQLTQKAQQLFQKPEERLARVQHVCSFLVEEGPWPQAWIVLLNAERFPEHAVQAGVARPAEELLDNTRGGWPYCLLRASHREHVFTLVDPSFSCGACPRIAACQPYGHWVFGIEYQEHILGILVVGIPRNRLTHTEEKNTLLLLADLLAEDLQKPKQTEAPTLPTGKIFHPQQFRLFQNAVDASSVRIVLKDKQNLIRWCNQAFAQALDKHPIELVGKTLKDLFPYRQGEWLQADALENAALLKDQQPRRHIHGQRFPRPDESRWFLTEKTMYLTPDQRPAGVVEVSFEITPYLTQFAAAQPHLTLVTTDAEPTLESQPEPVPAFTTLVQESTPEYLN